MAMFRKFFQSFESLLAFRSFVLFCVFFIVLKFGLVDLLPAKLSSDSQKIVDPGVVDYELTGSFAATALFFASLPPLLLDLFVSAVSFFAFYFFSKDLKRVAGLVGVGALLVPMTLLCLLWPAKETVVVVLSILVLWIYRFQWTRAVRLGAVLVLYLVYAYLFRSYYALIVVFFVGFVFASSRGRIGVFLFFLTAAVIVCFAPPEFYDAAQGQRDRANDYARYIDSDNRTAFYNLIAPQDAVAFFLNYGYALLVLVVPIIFFYGVVDVIPTALFVFLLPKILRALKSRDARTSELTALFVGHWFVLVMFEPDVGSYLRHISSVFLYLSPLFGVYFPRSRSANREISA